MAEDLSRFERLGVLDPTAPDHLSRRALIEWFLERKVSDDEIVATLNDPDVTALYETFTNWSGQVLSARQIAERVGVDTELILDVTAASGTGRPDPHEPSFMEADLAAFELLRAAGDLFSRDELLAFVRVMGLSMSRVAEAANSLFLEDVERPMLKSGVSPAELLRSTVDAQGLANGLTAVLSMMMRRHMDASIQRTRQSESHAAPNDPMAPMVVGFVDLVGFTTRSASMSAGELALLVAKFESLATDRVTTLGGRLVKFIGDEMMFVAVDPVTGCRIGTALLQEFGSDPALTPRGGMAHGPVLAKFGDYFGPIVNLASRLVDQAVPGEILVTSDLAERSGLVLEPAGRRMLKGFPDPVSVASLTSE